jgi:low temperature requirement protein LtrA
MPAHPPLKHHYMLHRFGELTIIVLGEFFIKLVTTSSDLELRPFNFLLGGGLLLISLSLWWLYFDHTDHVDLQEGRTHPALWIYTHYFLLVAITAYGVVGTKVFAAWPGEILSPEKRILLCGALAIAVVALGVIDRASPEIKRPTSRSPHLGIRLGAALLVLLLAPLGAVIPVGWLLALVVLVLVGQVTIDVWMRTRNQRVAEMTASH